MKTTNKMNFNELDELMRQYELSLDIERKAVLLVEGDALIRSNYSTRGVYHCKIRW